MAPTSPDVTRPHAEPPVAPLTSGVVLPQMVVTLAVESPEARRRRRPTARAADPPRPARAPGGDRLRRDRHDRPCGERGRAAGRRPGARPARARARRRRGAGSERGSRRVGGGGSGDATGRDSGGRVAGRRAYRAVVRGIAERLGSPRVADALSGVDDSAALADTAGWSPDLTRSSRRSSCSRRSTRRRASSGRSRGRADALAELDVSEQIRSRVSDDMDKTQRGVHAAPAARRRSAQELGEAGGRGLVRSTASVCRAGTSRKAHDGDRA